MHIMDLHSSICFMLSLSLDVIQLRVAMVPPMAQRLSGCQVDRMRRCLWANLANVEN